MVCARTRPGKRTDAISRASRTRGAQRRQRPESCVDMVCVLRSVWGRWIGTGAASRQAVMLEPLPGHLRPVTRVAQAGDEPGQVLGRVTIVPGRGLGATQPEG